MNRNWIRGLLSIACTTSSCLLAAASASATPPGIVVSAAGPTTTFTPEGPSPATVPQSEAQCPVYRLCMWSGQAYTGVFWNAGGSNTDFQYVGAGFNDQASSLWNRRTNASWVDKDYPDGTDYACTGGGGGWYYPYLSRVGWPQDRSSANKSISSFWIPNATYNNCSGQPQLH